MSALSIPPSQKTNISVGLESIHNYANVPVALVGADQYSVVTVYTEMEVGASEVDEDVIKSTELQTDFYEEEIEAVTVDNVASEELSSLKAEETSETVDVAKALEILTKTFVFKESLGQDVLTGKFTDSHDVDEEQATVNTEEKEEGDELSDKSDQQPGSTESAKKRFDESDRSEDVSSELSEAQRPVSSTDACRSTLPIERWLTEIYLLQKKNTHVFRNISFCIVLQLVNTLSR